MLLADVVTTSHALGATRSRKAKTQALAAVLRAAAPEEVETLTAYLSGVLRQRRTGLGYRSLTNLPPPAEHGTLTVGEVHDELERISVVSGAGAKAARTALVADLFGRATAEEQEYLVRLATGELRQGALDGLMLEAIALASGVPAAAVRRAAMLCGATVPVAVAALTGGAGALDGFGLVVGRPVRPMLASSAADLPSALDKLGPGTEVAVDQKLDGIRIQVHKDEKRVAVFTRTLEDITDRLPEVVEAVSGLPARTIVLDGEAIALDASGRPRPFQETAARTASRVDVAALREQVPLTSYFFDLLHLDGTDLIDAPARDRFRALASALPESLVVPRVVTGDPAEAAAYFDAVVGLGHEGVVVKSLGSAYDAGRRGASWVKVKPRHTLDLVVLAVEWGSGRRKGKLSNIHLGARGEDGGLVMLGKTFKNQYEPGWTMVGKTFKGMSDEMLAWQTERFLDLETNRDGHVVYVRTEQVVEIAFDGVQRSSRYPGGVALRFARVVRYRDDKLPKDSDTITALQSLLSD